MQKALILVALTIVLTATLPNGSVAQETHVCDSCGEGIRGAYFETKGHFYHPEHFVCAQCGQPIKSAYTTYRGVNYHTRCFEEHVALRCAICGGVIQGHYIIDNWGNGYHVEHKDDVPTCDFCMRFITNELYDGMVNYSDGRTLCGICHKTAVKNIEEAHALMREVAGRLKRFGIRVDTDRVSLHLVGHKAMQLQVHKHAYGLRGFTDYQEERNFFGIVKRRQVDVYVLYGAPRMEMMATLAHELTHAWQFLGGRLQVDQALLEGSCNYSSYLVMRKVGGPEAEFIMQRMIDDDNPIYGEGFRRVKRYAEENGLTKWLKLLEDNEDLPRYSLR